MIKQFQPQAKAASTPIPSFTPVRAGLIQRKCACSGAADMQGGCEECSNKKLSLQRSSTGSTHSATAPPVVNDVLRSQGQPLDPATRAFMEPRFGHDFSKVRVHTDTSSAESARAVNALAYTVNKNIVFGRGQYEPATSHGQRLIAHELTHVVQQGQAQENGGLQTAGAYSYDGANSPSEREADAVAKRIISGGDAGLLSSRPTPPIQLQGGADAGPAPPAPSSPPTITTINVHMNNPQNVSLDWSDGTHTTGIQCSTGQGRCCPRPCDPPANTVNGSNCTPDGTFTVDHKYLRTGGGLNFFVSFVAARSIGLHEYSPVNGTPLSHGCVRLHRADAETVYNGAVPGTTTVNVDGTAVPNCPRPRVPNCPGATGASTGAVGVEAEEALAQNMDQEPTNETDPPIA